MNKLVSIIVPVYNVELYLDRCIKSILNGTYKNIELILVNDGSKDSSLDICNKYKSDKRVVIINKQNEGVSETRNRGIKESHGYYIMFVDSDDWIDNDTIEKCVKSIGKSDLLMFPYVREFEKNSIVRHLYNKPFKCVDKDKLFYDYIGPYNSFISNPLDLESKNMVTGRLYKKSLLKAIKFIDFKKTVGEDLLFNLEYSKKIKSYKYIESTYYHYNKLNCSSITKIDSSNRIDRWEYMFTYIEKQFDSNDLKACNCLNNRIIINLFNISLQVYNSNNSKSIKKKILRNTLDDKYFYNRFNSFSFKYLSLKWKLFYKCLKYKNINLLFILLDIMNLLRKFF